MARTKKDPSEALKEWLSREREAHELLKNVPASVIGARIRRARQRMGLSIRDLAAVAGVSKNSIVRIEQGGVSNVSTILKVSAAMGIHVATLAKPTGETQVMALHRHEDSRWFDLTDFGAGPLGGLDRPLSEEERAKFVKDGTDTPLLILKSRLETGRLLSTVIELYHESERRSHAGEEFVYVLRGHALVHIGAQTVELTQGESVVFWSAEEHSYAPAEGSELPVQVLSVRLDDRPARKE
jgi:transcriptional regulator with XRE-family HTH domain